MIFGHAVIAWIFFLIFYYCKILNFGLLKVGFWRKKQKDVRDDGSMKIGPILVRRLKKYENLANFGKETEKV